MKRLGVSIFTLVSFVFALGLYFTPTSVNAQSLSGEAKAQYDKGVDLFTTQITSLETSPSRKQLGEDETLALIKLTRYAQSIFENVYKKDINGGKNPKEAYTAALNSAQYSTQTLSLTNSNADSSFILTDDEKNILNGLTEKRIIDAFVAVLGAAQPVDYKDQAPNSFENGVKKAQTSASAAVVDIGKKCSSIITSTTLDLIDCSVSWLIKNTLLQIAGFLVWLSANMLNYSIQVSILDFNTWASTSLYPVWIIIRQTVSLGIIFAGLYLGFLYIIGKNESFGRYVAWLVLFAIFVNFSYPITRTLADISNVISLNVYSATVGNQALATDFSSSVAPWAQQNTAGAIIVNRLGLQDLAVGATAIPGSASSFVNGINSTPGALLADIFVFYTAFVFFMATGIIAIRTVLLILLIVASPLLFIDSVVPKLGDVSMKLRKLFFEQLVVAPVFMIMLALTLKFLEIFQANKALSGNGSTLVQTGDATVQTFFTLLIMLIMLHVMLKVTKGVSGSAGTFATNFMGKVGGFGLGVASGGVGVLSRGTIGKMAAGVRDSRWMDTMKDTTLGRGLSGATNFLANSTYDTRNIGMVSSGLSKAGITGGFGVSMQKSSVKGFDDKKKEREKDVVDFGKGIRDDATRENYFANANALRLVRVDKATTDEAQRELKEKRFSQLATYLTADEDKRKSMLNQANISKDYVLASKLEASEKYLGVPNNAQNAAINKATQLKAMGIQENKEADALLKKDPFEDINKAADEEIRKLDEEARAIDRSTEKGKADFAAKQAEIGKAKNERDSKIRQLRQDTLAAFAGGRSTQPNNPSSPTAGATPVPNRPAPSGGSQNIATSNTSPQTTRTAAPLVQTPEPVTTTQAISTASVPQEPRREYVEARAKREQVNQPTQPQTTQPIVSETPSVPEQPRQEFVEARSRLRPDESARSRWQTKNTSVTKEAEVTT